MTTSHSFKFKRFGDSVTKFFRLFSVIFASAMLWGCGGSSGTNNGATSAMIGTPTVTDIRSASAADNSGLTSAEAAKEFVAAVATVPLMTDKEAYDIAINLWRDDDLTRHPKGSCAGCHGADFFDLSRIGAAEVDILRRSQIDGASALEAKALAQAIKAQRLQFSMPATNPRTFRPFQPGGSVLLPELATGTDPAFMIPVKRDIAFAKQLEPLLPRLFGSRIDNLADAKIARDQIIDLVNGTNLAGANPKLLNMRKLPSGIEYPRWSADFHHGAKEGTFNDWIADIAHDPKPEKKAEWQALQNAYLKDSSNENFWKMFNSVTALTSLPLLGACEPLNGPIACGAVDDFNRNKFLSSLIGQHIMRLESKGAVDTFLRGAVSMAYIDTDPLLTFMNTRPNVRMLPAAPWEVGDMGRVIFESNASAGSLRTNLKSLGFPEFALNSIDPNKSAIEEERDLRLAWFWLGFTFDTSMARISKSNATRVGEYMVGTLVEERMFNHMMFSGLARLVTTGFIPEATVINVNGKAVQSPPKFMMEYGYLWGYGRAVLDNTWNENRNLTVPPGVKAEMTDYFSRMTGNGFRMSTLLQLDALNKNQLNTNEIAAVTDWLKDSVLNNAVRRGGLYAMYEHFNKYYPTTLAQDVALLDSLRIKLNIASPW
jgi:hypothetical protein